MDITMKHWWISTVIPETVEFQFLLCGFRIFHQNSAENSVGRQFPWSKSCICNYINSLKKVGSPNFLAEFQPFPWVEIPLFQGVRCSMDLTSVLVNDIERNWDYLESFEDTHFAHTTAFRHTSSKFFWPWEIANVQGWEWSLKVLVYVVLGLHLSILLRNENWKDWKVHICGTSFLIKSTVRSTLSNNMTHGKSVTVQKMNHST